MFRRDEGGTVVVVVALVLPAILIGTGGAIELTRAVTFRQQLMSAVELSCKQAALYVNHRKSEDLDKGLTVLTYPNEVAGIAARNFKAKNIPDGDPPITVNTDSNVHVEAKRTMPLVFARLLGTNSMNFSAAQDCAVTPYNKIFLNPEKPAVVFRESFEGEHNVAATGSGWGVFGGYNKNSWNGWTTQGAGVEIDSQRAIAVSRVLFGAYFAELDSDCKTATNKGNQSCKSNSTLSRKLDARPGTYQIRYWYVSRKGDSSLGKRVVCGAKDKDVAFYTKDGQTNRIEIYFQKFDSKKEKEEIKEYKADDLIDVCVLSNEWTERVINVKIPTAGEYLFTWRAAGREDTYGGLIDNLRICENFCPAT